MTEDYNAIDMTVNFPPNTSPGDAGDQQCFSLLTIINDLRVEFTETITLEASSTNPAVQFTQGGGNRATVNIIDDDGECA